MGLVLNWCRVTWPFHVISSVARKKALAKTSNSGLQAALDWLANNQDNAGENLSEDEDNDPKSLCCNDCGKLFSSVALAQLHAAKSGHQEFSESDKALPELTWEEKTARLLELKRKLAEKKASEAKALEEEAKQAELLRRKSGHTAAQARREMAEREMIKAAEQMRKDREEEKQIRARIRAEIEEEKRLRKEAAETVTRPSQGTQSEPQKVPTLVSDDSKATRIQVKLPNGESVRGVFRAEEKLASLLDKISEKSELDNSSRLVVPFPHKIINPSVESEMTLGDLGLCPSASLVLKP